MDPSVAENSREGDAPDRTKDAVESMIAFADRPLKELMARLEGVSVEEKWGCGVMVDVGYISTESVGGEMHHVQLAVVPKDHVMDMGNLEGDSKALESMSYLANSAMTIYRIMKSRGETGTRNLKVDVKNTTLYFHSSDPFRIGLLVEKK